MPTSVAVRKVLPLFFIIWALAGRPVWAGPPEPVFPGEGWCHATDVRMFGWSPEKLAEARQVAAAIGSAAVMVVDRGRSVRHSAPLSADPGRRHPAPLRAGWDLGGGGAVGGFIVPIQKRRPPPEVSPRFRRWAANSNPRNITNMSQV
jgi:hypothetical protein